MEKHRIRSLVGVLAVLSFSLSGCIVYSGDISYGEKGKPLSNSTLGQIECGKTTRDWVVTTLGEPSRQSTTADGLELLEYRYSRKKDNTFVFVPFVIINDEGEDLQTVYFEIKDGVVKKYWKETSRR